MKRAICLLLLAVFITSITFSHEGDYPEVQEKHQWPEQYGKKQVPKPHVPSYEPKVEPKPHVPSYEPKVEPKPYVPSYEKKEEPKPYIPKYEPKVEPKPYVPSYDKKQEHKPYVPSYEKKQEHKPYVPSYVPKVEPKPYVPKEEPKQYKPKEEPKKYEKQEKKHDDYKKNDYKEKDEKEYKKHEKKDEYKGKVEYFTLTFDTAARDGLWNQNSNKFIVEFNGRNVAKLFPSDYEIHQRTFKLRGRKGKNSIHFIGAGDSDSYGSQIDNVKLIKGKKNYIKNGGFEEGYYLETEWLIFKNGEYLGWSCKDEMEVGWGRIYNIRWNIDTHVCELDANRNSDVYQNFDSEKDGEDISYHKYDEW